MTPAAATPTLNAIEAAASQRATRSHAIDLAIDALGRGIENPLVLRLVGEGLEKDGRLQDAMALAHRATVLDPDNAEAWTEFSRLLLRLGRGPEAAAAARQAVDLGPENFAVQLNAAAAEFSLNAFEAAARHAREAARLRPEAGEPPSTLAIIRARQRRFAEARRHAERALALDPALPGAQIAAARVDLAENETGRAIGRLQRLLAATDLAGDHRAEALSLLGEARDAAGEPSRAFAAFTASNAVMAKRASALAARSQSAADHARMMERYFQEADPAVWQGGPGEDRMRPSGVLEHAFIIGFPRSGTTLLENALASHPRVVALEESDALAHAGSTWLADEVSLDRLARLTADEADQSRKIYWQRVQDVLGAPIEGKVFIDKMPMNIIALPAVAKLFPDAKILLARRDPRDVVLSCYRRLFGVNAVVREFHTLAGTAHYYDQVMRLAAIYTEKLSLSLRIIAHEELVEDFDGVIAMALGFLGLPWNRAVRNFPRRAIRAKTPSATQLARGLNAESVGAWRGYARHTAPVLPILEPWVARFGYPPTDPEWTPAAPAEGFAAFRESIGKALAAGEWNGVWDQVEEAFAKGFSDPLLFRLRGIRAQQEGRLDAAISDFELALDEAPGDAALQSALGLCLARLGRAAEALSRLDEAIALQPDFAPAHFNRGFAFETMGEITQAEGAYARAATLDPRHGPALGALAILASRRAYWDQARAAAEGALALESDLPTALIALAAAEAAGGEPDRAERRLRALIAGPTTPSPHELAIARCALGEVLDHLDRTGEAFAAFRAGAAGLLAIHSGRFEASGKERSSALADRLDAFFRAADARPWRRPNKRPANGESRGHVFVLGFPRSGTTLLGQALASHPEAVTLEERETLADASEVFFRDADSLARLSCISEVEARRHREAYWLKVRSSGVNPDGRLFVDKLPMNTLGLPIIAKLFPSAKIVFLRRDPRDVVLSCFRHQFVINPTTVEFLTLEGAASLYAATMRLMETYQAKLDLDVHIQRYEALVTDFEGEMAALTAFVGLTFDERMKDFASRAGAVATPSSAQLAAGLNAAGVGRWRRYREELSPILPVVAAWVKKFGYPDT